MPRQCVEHKVEQWGGPAPYTATAGLPRPHHRVHVDSDPVSLCHPLSLPLRGRCGQVVDLGHAGVEALVDEGVQK